MKLLSQTTSLRVEVVVTLGQEAQEEESQVSQGTDEALMINLETVFLNQVEVAQDQVTAENRTLAELEDLSEVDLEDQILAELEDLSEVDLEDQILAELEDQVTAENRTLAELEDQATIQKINQITKKQAQSQKPAGKRIKPF